MAIGEHAKEFAGKPVRDWDPDKGIFPEKVNYRISIDWDASQAGELWTDKFAAFLEHPNAAQATGLLVGNWGEVATGDESTSVVEALVSARDRLPNLTALLLGDITFEESEISWIVQSDVSPLFSAYPRLETFQVRGGHGLRFGGLRHDHLKSLIVETGGLPVEALRDVMSAHLPALEHLELWLGDSGYGWSGSISDLIPLLRGEPFPNLRYLGLRNSEIADEIATEIATSPLLSRLSLLDLSLGTLSDVGAQALLASPSLTQMEKLDLHHHYLSEAMTQRLMELPLTVDVSDVQEGDQDDDGEEFFRYVAVGE